MKLDALIVVNMQILSLRNRKHRVILQKADISNFFLGLELGDKALSLPLDHCQVALAGAHQSVLAVAGHVKGHVGPEVGQAEAENVVGSLHWQFFPELFLCDF